MMQRSKTIRLAILASAGLALVVSATRVEPSFAQESARTPRASTAPRTAEELLANLRNSPGFLASFQEEKRMAMLRNPVRSEGRVAFRNPGHFARHTERPSQESMLLEGNTLRTRRGGRVETIDLSSRPVAASFIASLNGVLSGDLQRLQRDYNIDFQRNGESFVLTLRPKGSPLDRIVRELRFEGTSATINSMDMLEPNGDRTHTTFRDVDAHHSFSPEEQRTLFTL